LNDKKKCPIFEHLNFTAQTFFSIEMFLFKKKSKKAHEEAFMMLKEMYPSVAEGFLMDLVEKYQGNADETVVSIVEKISKLKMIPLKRLENEMLISLLEQFPQVETEYARETVVKHGWNATVALLKEDYPLRTREIMDFDLFRNDQYIKGATIKLMNDFPYHFESTIKAIMAENNNDYPTCHNKLSEMKIGFLWKSLPFTRRMAVYNIALENVELKRDIAFMMRKDTSKDLEVAQKLNYKQYQIMNQLIDCQCCFVESTFENMVQCTNGHLFCKECIERTVSIGMYETGTVRGKRLDCLSSEEVCAGYFTMKSLKFLPNDLYYNYENSIALKQTNDAGIRLVVCPFCNYFEEAPPEYKFKYFFTLLEKICENIFQTAQAALFTVSFAWIIVSENPFNTTSTLVLIYLMIRGINWDRLEMRIKALPEILRPPKYTLNCKNPRCLQQSCVDCKKKWVGAHICFEKEKDSKRTYIELAMSRALIRTCAICNIRFSKLDGCNKMTCPLCKYVMCYVCRKDIRQQGYAHFCQVNYNLTIAFSNGSWFPVCFLQ
jgi:hypothetical protein